MSSFIDTIVNISGASGRTVTTSGPTTVAFPTDSPVVAPPLLLGVDQLKHKKRLPQEHKRREEGHGPDDPWLELR
jgi:hypothetical protein